MRLGRTCFKGFKGEGAYAKPKNNRKRSDGERRRNSNLILLKKETKESGAGRPHLLRTNIRYRKTKNIGKYKEIRCLYFIVYNLRK